MQNVTNNEINVLGNINVVAVSLKFFGGSSSLTAEDLGIQDGVLPQDVVALGSKKIVNKDLLKGFAAVRKNIQRKGLLKGTSFLGGYAMSPEAAKEYLSDVNKMLAELEVEVEQFLKNYPTYVQDWANMHPQWTDAILKAAPSVQAVRSRFQFKTRCFKVSQPGEQLGDGGLAEEISGLAEQILSEIAKDVKLTWKDRGYGDYRIRPTLVRAAEKAKSLSFIDPDLNKVHQLIQGTLDALPSHGKIEGTDYLLLKGQMDMLLDPKKIIADMKSQDQLAVPEESLTSQDATETAPEVAATTAVDSDQMALPAMDSQSISIEVIQPDVSAGESVATQATPVVQPEQPSASSWTW